MGGKFHISNTADFAESTKIGEIKRNPEMEWDSIAAATKGMARRYVRYAAPHRSNCNVAEMAFYDASGKKLHPIAVVTNDSTDTDHKAGRSASSPTRATNRCGTERRDYLSLVAFFTIAGKVWIV